MPLRIWCNVPLPAPAMQRLRRAVAGHDLLERAREGPFHAAAPDDEPLEGCDVAFGQPPPALLRATTSLRWAHLSSAGYTAYDDDDLRAALRARGLALTNSSSVYDEPCAEHALALVLALCRGLPFAHDDQRGGRRWLQSELRARARRLQGARALLVGYGSIGRRLAPRLAALGVVVEGLRRSPREDDLVPTFGLDRAQERLAQADFVVDLLPASSSTRGFFSTERFAAMNDGAFFVNIGRGDTVDQDALLRALASGRLGAAYLDVTTPEPLPADSPLWSAPRCFVTPHAAGGREDEMDRLVDHFTENLARFQAGLPLLDRIA